MASEAWRHIEILRQIRNHAVRDYYRGDYNQHNKLTEWTDRWPTFAEPSQHTTHQAISRIHDDIETLQERR
ncbi:MAG: hypothetical protein J07HQX50_02386, partial [Haloquadratum sp. J07HQX50]